MRPIIDRMYLLALLLSALTALPSAQAQRRPAAPPTPFTTPRTAALTSRGPLTEKQQKLVHNLQPEFNGTKHVKGIVSMARGDDPASATTSFFIVTADAPTLDGKYTVFGRVIDGLDVLDTIESTPVSGESPLTRVDLIKVRIAG